MKTQIKERISGKITMEVELEAPVFQSAVDKAAKKLAHKVSIPGFRKGKVPKKVLEKFVGSEALCAEAVDDILPKTYVDAIEKEKIEPIDQPNIDIVQFEQGKPFIFTAEISVKPDVELGEYKGLEVSYEKQTIGDKEVDNYLGTMQQRHAQIEAVPDQAIENENTAVIDFEGFLDGVPFEGGKGENYNLVIGSQTFIPGFEEQLIGLKAGEEKEIKVTFPEEYQSEDLKGKEVVFKVKVNEVKVKKLMPLDDEFAKDVSEFDTLEELKVDIENRLNTMATQENDQRIRMLVLEKVAANTDVEVPAVMIEAKTEELVQDMEFRLKQQGLDLESYLKYTNGSMDQLKEQHKENAKNSVKIDLILEAIAQKEGIEVSEEEIDKEIEKIATQNKQPVEQIKKVLELQGRNDTFKESIRMDKTVNYLLENTKINELLETESQELSEENDKENVSE